jgi:tetratricopeptide (TPR) repeat protein
MLADTKKIQDLNSNEDSYADLVSLIDLSQGMMVLIIASCHSEVFQDELIERYESELAIEIPSYRVKLDRSEPSLRAALEKLVNEQPELNQPKASAVISVTGANNLMSIPVREEETNSALDRFFGYLQWTREGLREFPFPIVLWVTPKILKKLSGKSPDFWSWRSGVFQFIDSSTLMEINLGSYPQTSWWSITRDKSNNLPLDELLDNISKLEQQNKASPALATLVDRVGKIYASQITGDSIGDGEIAIAYFNRAIALQETLSLWSDRTNTLQRLADVYYDLGRYQEAENLYRECLDIKTELDDGLEFTSLWNALGEITFMRGEWDEAESLFQKSLDFYTKLNDLFEMADSLCRLGTIANKRGNWDEAEGLYQRSLKLSTELDDIFGIASLWGCLGDIARNKGNWDGAEDIYQKSLKLFTQSGSLPGVAMILGVLGDVARHKGNWDEAETLYQRALKLRTELGDRSEIAIIWGCLGENELGRGNLDMAEEWLIKAVEKMKDLSMTWDIAETNWDLAQVYRSKPDHQKAQEHYEIAQQLFTELGAKKDLKKIETNWNSALK